MTVLSKTPLYVFAKAPIPGQVKTRLLSSCSAEQAARIAEILLTETLSRCTQYWPGETVLSVGNDPQHASVVALADRFNVRIIEQEEGDLGARMLAAFHTAYAANQVAAVIGADASLVSAITLQTAHSTLAGGGNVLGPSADGGYYFIGLIRPEPALFSGVHWGTSSVYAHTISQAKLAGVALHPLPVLTDVDEWADVLLAQQHIHALAVYLRAEALI